MNIVVCIKQVLDTTDQKFDAATGRLVREGQPTTLNALDEYAVEEGLRLREAHGGTVTALTMGPATALDALRHAVAMGADAAVHICDDAVAGGDTLATAYVLSRAIARMDSVDLILCGAEAMDGATACVGPAIAQNLQIPYVSFVSKIEEMGDGKTTVQRMMEEGYDRVALPLPALLSVVKGINEPRITSLKGKMKAKKMKPEMLTLADIADADAARAGTAGSASRVVRTFPPESRASGQLLEGEPADIAEKLYQLLSN
jgi:electron transfer flavoprotein alpha/beta subunit